MSVASAPVRPPTLGLVYLSLIILAVLAAAVAGSVHRLHLL